MIQLVIEKISMPFKLVFGGNRVCSSNSIVQAKTKRGPAAATSGNGSSIYINSNIQIYKNREPREIIAHTKAKKALLNAFSPRSAQKFISDENQSMGHLDREYNLKGARDTISSLFKNIKIECSDSCAAEFNRIAEGTDPQRAHDLSM